jgi:hypothetical protein
VRSSAAADAIPPRNATARTIDETTGFICGLRYSDVVE